MPAILWVDGYGLCWNFHLHPLSPPIPKWPRARVPPFASRIPPIPLPQMPSNTMDRDDAGKFSLFSFLSIFLCLRHKMGRFHLLLASFFLFSH
jgi:hypothetical protein